jgi:hypothetical protein
MARACSQAFLRVSACPLAPSNIRDKRDGSLSLPTGEPFIPPLTLASNDEGQHLSRASSGVLPSSTILLSFLTHGSFVASRSIRRSFSLNMWPLRSPLVALFCTLAMSSGVWAFLGPNSDLHIVNKIVSPDGYKRSYVSWIISS